MKHSQVKVYIPDIDKLTGHQLDSFERAICNEFGGATIYPNCKGLWMNTTNYHIETDNITVYEIFTTRDKLDIVDIIEPEVKLLGQILKQKCMLFVLNNETYYVPTNQN